MGTTEADVSVLIPSYRRPLMTLAAVEWACSTRAGEILVSDDASNDDTLETLQSVRDGRLRIVAQPLNLGLWRNHFALLRMATRPWVKFLQNDDRISSDGLRLMVEAIGPETSVVSSLDLLQDAKTNELQRVFELSQTRRWTSDEYLRRLLVFGNELGSPTSTLFRADALERSEEAWSNDKSSDLISNVMAASRGEVVLLPPGATITVDHEGRDTHVGSWELSHKRLLNTVRYLAHRPDQRVRRFARVFGVVEGVGAIRNAAGMLRRRGSLYNGFVGDVTELFGEAWSWTLVRDVPSMSRMLRLKYGKRTGLYLDAL